MSSDSRSVAVTKYFTKTPRKPTYAVPLTFAIIGVVVGLSSLIRYLTLERQKDGCITFFLALLIVFGVGVFAAAVGLIRLRQKKYQRQFAAAEPKPTDQQIEEWHKQDLEGLRQFALTKLDLVPEEVRQYNKDGPLVIVGPGPSPSVRIGADGVARFTTHNVVIIYLTRYHLGAFQCIKDLRNGGLHSYSTQEYHYSNIQAVATQTDNTGEKWEIDGQTRDVRGLQKFSLSVASGEKIEVAIGFSHQDHPMGKGWSTETIADHAVRVIRAQLREKTGGTDEPTAEKHL
jgi:hypothetical protein